jgi:uncharacterized damage-inducible protein DinB
MEDVRYPIGKFSMPESSTPVDRALWVESLTSLPGDIAAAVTSLNDDQLDIRYRDGGWTVRQVIHHLADSHMNAFIRMKLAMTENHPTIKPYDEASWAQLSDAHMEIEPSLVLLKALHHRWLRLIESLTEDDFHRTFDHPESGTIRLDQQLALYAWHGRHHLGHIKAARIRQASA